MDPGALMDHPIELVESNRQLARILEGLLFAAGQEGMTPDQIAVTLDTTIDQAYQLIDILDLIQREEQRTFHIHLIDGAWQLFTVPELSPYLKKMSTTPTPTGLSQAALETLAIIAFRQPVTRMEIDEIRGVKSDRAISTLISRGLIHETGRSEGPGRPILYGTSKEFMDYFGLSSLHDLIKEGE